MSKSQIAEAIISGPHAYLDFRETGSHGWYSVPLKQEPHWLAHGYVGLDLLEAGDEFDLPVDPAKPDGEKFTIAGAHHAPQVAAYLARFTDGALHPDEWNLPRGEEPVTLPGMAEAEEILAGMRKTIACPSHE